MREPATKLPSHKLGSDIGGSLLTVSARLGRVMLDMVSRVAKAKRDWPRRERVAFVSRYPLIPNSDYQAHPEAATHQTVRRALAASDQLDRFLTDTLEHMVDSGTAAAAYAELLRNL